MSYNYFSELLKRRKIMKQTYTEQQYAFIAKEKLYQLFQSVRSVISIDLQESTKTERYISDFSIKLHTQYEKIVLFVEVKSNREKRFIVDFINRAQNAFIKLILWIYPGTVVLPLGVFLFRAKDNRINILFQDPIRIYSQKAR